MDEPTNHLDLASSEALIEALKGYDGTLLFVSHNRSFVNGLATRIWEVKDGGILDQPGNLDDWLYHQQQLQAGGERATDGQRSEALRDGGGEKERRRREAEARNTRRAREKPLRDAIARLEARIGELEALQRAAEAALGDPALYQDFARARPHVEALAAAKDELARLYPELGGEAARAGGARRRVSAAGDVPSGPVGTLHLVTEGELPFVRHLSRPLLLAFRRQRPRRLRTRARYPPLAEEGDTVAKKLPVVSEWPVLRQLAHGDLVGLGANAYSRAHARSSRRAPPPPTASPARCARTARSAAGSSSTSRTRRSSTSRAIPTRRSRRAASAPRAPRRSSSSPARTAPEEGPLPPARAARSGRSSRSSRRWRWWPSA